MVAFCFTAAVLWIAANATMVTMRGADTNTDALQNAAVQNAAVQNPAPAPRLKSTVRVDAHTGRLVRVMVPIPTARLLPQAQPHHAAPPDPAIQALVDKTAKDYNVNPALVNSVISVESGFNPSAVSWKGAQGIMQLMPATARRFGVSDAFDVKQNVEGGVRYLRFLQDTFKDDTLAIAAYNAGEGAVAKYNGVPPYRETIDYVKKVGQQLEAAKKKLPPPPEQQKPEVEPEEKQPQLATFYDEHGRLHVVTDK